MIATSKWSRTRFTRELNSFKNARKRCRNPRDKDYPYYGARGIQFKFARFYDFMEELGPCPAGLTLDRIKSTGNYEPGNVRWADKDTQNRNRKSSRWITAFGKTMVMTDWAKQLGIHKVTLRHRLANHPPEIAFLPREEYLTRRRGM